MRRFLILSGTSLTLMFRRPSCVFLCVSQLLSIFSVSDIDPVSVIPAQPQVVMLGDKVEWQCKTKASAAHTVQWKKVRSIAFLNQVLYFLRIHTFALFLICPQNSS